MTSALRGRGLAQKQTITLLSLHEYDNDSGAKNYHKLKDVVYGCPGREAVNDAVSLRHVISPKPKLNKRWDLKAPDLPSCRKFVSVPLSGEGGTLLQRVLRNKT